MSRPTQSAGALVLHWTVGRVDLGSNTTLVQSGNNLAAAAPGDRARPPRSATALGHTTMSSYHVSTRA
jgi:hypothetical protein